MASAILATLGDFQPLGLLAGTHLLAALNVQAMSHAAAMVLIIPIAVDTERDVGANHITSAVAVVTGEATSFLTPTWHKANVLVFRPGGYRFFGYERVGTILTVVVLVVSMMFVPLFWPLFPWQVAGGHDAARSQEVRT